MSVLDKLTVKPLLYALGACVLVIAALVAVQWVQSARHAAAIAQAEKAAEGWQAQATGSNTRVQELQAANAGYGDTVALLQKELQAAQEQAVVIGQQQSAAVSAAEAATADAERTLKTFMNRYAVQSRKADCALALQQVEAVCPAFSGY